MSALEPLFRLLNVNVTELAQTEHQLLDAWCFAYVCAELKDYFRQQYHDYLHLLKLTPEQEENMLEANLARMLIQDILATEEYTITGIAYYTNTHADIIDEVMMGCNTNPSALLFRKLVELHGAVRRELYRTLLKKALGNGIRETSENI